MSKRLIHWTRATTSTNDQALSASDAEPGTIWLTDHQTEGRGRRTGSGHRVWFAPPGGSVLMSMRFEPRLSPERTPILTLAAAVGCAEALASASGLDVRLKWPNDLLVGGRKLGGLLTEGLMSGAGMVVVIGIGINVNIVQSDFPPSIASLATSLQIEAGQTFDRLTLISGLAPSIEAAVETAIERGGLGPLHARWSALSAMDGRRVRVLSPKDLTGVARGISEAGGLIVDVDDGSVVEITSGEVLWE